VNKTNFLETKHNFEILKQFWCSANESIVLSNNKFNFCDVTPVLKDLSRILKILFKRPLCLSSSPWLWDMRLNQNAKYYLKNYILTKTMVYKLYTPSNIFSSSNTSSWKLSRIFIILNNLPLFDGDKYSLLWRKKHGHSQSWCCCIFISGAS